MRIARWGHVAEARLTELADGTVSPAVLSDSEAGHLHGCGHCQSLLDGHRLAARLLAGEWRMVSLAEPGAAGADLQRVQRQVTAGALLGRSPASWPAVAAVSAGIVLLVTVSFAMWAAYGLYVGGPDPTDQLTPTAPVATPTAAPTPPVATPTVAPTPFAGPYLPEGIALSPSGNVYFSDCRASHVLRVEEPDEAIVVAGSGEVGFSGDGGLAIEARLHCPVGLAFDASGDLHVAVYLSRRIRRVAADGTITTIAGGARSQDDIGDGGPATEARLFGVVGLAFDEAGALYVSGDDDRIRRIDREGIITTIAGTAAAGFGGDGGPATAAQLNDPTAMAFDAVGNLYFTDTGNHRVRRIATDGTITTAAGTGEEASSGDGGPATEAALAMPTGLAIDAAGNVYVAEVRGNRVRRIDPDGLITTVAGTGTAGFSGDGGRATDAQLNFAYATGGKLLLRGFDTLPGVLVLAIDAQGNLYIADTGNHRVRVVDQAGVITTFFDGSAR